jgi:hypothetical protein
MSLRHASFLFLIVSLSAGVSMGAVACGSKSSPAEVGPTLDASTMPLALDANVPDRALLPETYHPDAACLVSVDTPALLPAQHVAIGSDIAWDSNPPSSGPHFPIWAAYQAYTSPVPRGYYVHDLEHGAIVLLYKCDPDGGNGGIDCTTIQASLQQVSDALPDDPVCTALGEGVRVRVVITPDPLLDVPVAAAAWGWTYRADCLDLPSLIDFARAHYGQGTEDLCNDGQSTF